MSTKKPQFATIIFCFFFNLLAFSQVSKDITITGKVIEQITSKTH